MNEEKILKSLAVIDENELLQDGYKYVVDILTEIKEDCEAIIRSKANKSAGRGKTEVLVKSITKKQQGVMQYLYTSEDGYQYAVDFHRAVRLNKHIEFKPLPAGEKYYNAEGLFEKLYLYPTVTLTYDINDMLGAYKVAKAEKNKGDIIVCVICGRSYNADYIADFVKVSPVVEIRQDGGDFPVVYMENEQNDVYLVLPIKADVLQDGIHNLTTGKYYG